MVKHWAYFNKFTSKLSSLYVWWKHICLFFTEQLLPSWKQFLREYLLIRTYRNYNKFYNHKFQKTLLHKLSLNNTWNNDISNFIDVFVKSQDKYAPPKKSYNRGNHLIFMNKELPKVIMSRSKLCHTFLQNRSKENRKKCSKQWHYCVSLFRRKLLIIKSFGKRLPNFFWINFYQQKEYLL